VITFEFARAIIVDEIGPELPFELPEAIKEKYSESADSNPLAGVKALTNYQGEDGYNTITKDETGTEFKSVYSWTPEALERIFKIPSGFMRNKTQERAERVAMEAKALVIDLDTLNAGIDVGRKVMEQVVSSESDSAEDGKAKCPFSALFAEGEGAERAEAFQSVLEFYKDENNLALMGRQEQAEDNQAADKKDGPVSHVHTGAVPEILNQAGLMREIERRRREIKEK
jgi:hypothetical protein